MSLQRPNARAQFSESDLSEGSLQKNLNAVLLSLQTALADKSLLRGDIVSYSLHVKNPVTDTSFPLVKVGHPLRGLLVLGVERLESPPGGFADAVQVFGRTVSDGFQPTAIVGLPTADNHYTLTLLGVR